jgi:hypothetical protein
VKQKRSVQVVSIRDVEELYNNPKTEQFLKKHIKNAVELMEHDNNVGDYIKKETLAR